MSDKYAELRDRLLNGNIGIAEGYVTMTALLTDLAAANARIKELESLNSAYEHTEIDEVLKTNAQLVARAGEAEAMCEWLASHWLHDSDPYEVCLHNDITEAEILAAAREAVRHERPL